jgi:histidinol-phosphate aminotransferase
MTFTPERVVRPHIVPAASYTPAKSIDTHGEAVRLDFNENPFNLSPRARQAYEAFIDGNRYPPFAQDNLVAALAGYAGADASRIIAGAGLDDVFATLAIATIDAGDEVIISDPTFGVYRNLFEVHGASIVDVPLGPAPGFELDVDGIIAAANERTKLVIICNPNNPTGTLFSKDDIRKIIENVDTLVAIDEAYAEFSGRYHLDLANEYPNVVVLRTLSKFAGLAGFRVGYGIFPEPLMPWIRRAAPAFYNVSGVANAVAIASLADVDHLMENVALLNRERDRLREDLNAIPGIEAFESSANFILFRFPPDSEAAIDAALAARNVFIRRYKGTLAAFIRVSIGSPEENAIFLDAMREALVPATV